MRALQMQAEAFCSWHAILAKRRSMHSHGLRIAASSRDRRLLRRMMHAWRGHCDHTEKRAHHARLCALLRQWQQAAQRTTAARSQADDLAAKHAACLMRKAFYGWHCETVFMARVRQHACVHAEMRMVRMKALVFAHWLEGTKQAADLDRQVETCAEHRQMAATFLAWSQRTAEAAETRQRAENLAERRDNWVTFIAFANWAEVTAQAARTRRCASQVEQLSNKTMLSSVVVKWRSKAKWHLGEAQRELEALHRWVHGLLGRTLAAWRQVLLARRMREGIANAAVAKQSAQLLVRSFYQWRVVLHVLPLRQTALEGACPHPGRS